MSFRTFTITFQLSLSGQIWSISIVASDVPLQFYTNYLDIYIYISSIIQMVAKSERRKRKSVVAPDGGWGWVIVFCTSAILSLQSVLVVVYLGATKCLLVVESPYLHKKRYQLYFRLKIPSLSQNSTRFFRKYFL